MSTAKPSRPSVCETIVKHDLCVGCGICAGVCPSENLSMRWNDYGAYVPVDSGNCAPGCSLCNDVCPFADHDPNEDTFAELAFGQAPGIRHAPETGFYLAGYVGHVKTGDFRTRGSSGGMACWFLCSILERGTVDHVVAVLPDEDPGRLFKFAVMSSVDEVLESAKSRYHPVEMSGVIGTIKSKPGRYAVIGLPCFLKGLKLAGLQNKAVRERIVVYAGLTCSHMMSSRIVDLLARQGGVPVTRIRALSFREKFDKDLPMWDYLCRISNDDGNVEFHWHLLEGIGDVGATGQLKLHACDFCDDAFADVADITFMDAWSPPWCYDRKGTNIALARSQLALSVLQDGVMAGDLEISPMAVEDVICSQALLVKRKRTTLAHRLWLADRGGDVRPAKRVRPARPSSYDRKMILAMERLRAESHDAMRKQREASELGLDVYRDRIREPMLCVESLRQRADIIGRIRRAARFPFRLACRVLQRGRS